MACNTYEDCCPTLEKCVETRNQRRDNLMEIVNRMNIVDKSLDCPRLPEAKEDVCSRMNFGLSVVEPFVESSIWAFRKTNEMLLHFPFLEDKQKRLSENADEMFYEGIIAVNLFKGLNDKCDCGLDPLCPTGISNCKTDEIAELMDETSAKPGESERKVYEYVRDLYLREYLR